MYTFLRYGRDVRMIGEGGNPEFVFMKDSLDARLRGHGRVLIYSLKI